jgi:hypothetical protein
MTKRTSIFTCLVGAALAGTMLVAGCVDRDDGVRTTTTERTTTSQPAYVAPPAAVVAPGTSSTTTTTTKTYP